MKPRPRRSDASPASPRTGKELAVLGSCLGAAPEVAAALWDDPAAGRGVEDAGAAADADVPAGPALFASVACTSFSVMIRGGIDVMMVAVN